MKEAWLANIADLVADGIKDRTLRDDVNIKGAANVIVMALWGMGTLPLDAAGRQAVYRTIEDWLSPPKRAAQPA